MPNVLEGSLCYLIGPIDYASDQGKIWRKEITNKCQEMKIKFLNPTNKVTGLKKEVDEEQIKIKNLKKHKQWDTLSEFVKQIVRSDHRCVDICDFVICYINTKCHMCGSYFELQSALSQKKPYFIIVEGGKENTPSWLFGIIDHKRIFDSVNSVVQNLIDLNSEKIPLDGRWVLIRKEIEAL
ncbi:MAG: hypothetical protein WC755_02035 [Candidatus Woesearchaeota archaeon]|jgi:hypothetical protein